MKMPVAWRLILLDWKISPDLQQSMLTSVLCILMMEAVLMQYYSVIAKSPDIDCLFLNAGIQNPYELDSAQQFDLASFHEEVKVNFSSFVSLVHAFLPYFKKKTNPTSFVL